MLFLLLSFVFSIKNLKVTFANREILRKEYIMSRISENKYDVYIKNFKIIWHYAFSKNNQIASIVFLDSNTLNTSIAQYVFYGCDELILVVISNSVVSIGEYAFSNCKKLKNITFSKDSIIMHLMNALN